MADIKETDKSLEQRVIDLEADVRSIASGVNKQAQLLEAMVQAHNLIVQKYLVIVAPPAPKQEEPVNVEETKEETPA